jgi:hypothetical protein
MINNDEMLKNMINHSVMEKPLDFQSAFNTAITDRINDSISNRKIEIAQSLFRSPTEDEDAYMGETEENGEES